MSDSVIRRRMKDIRRNQIVDVTFLGTAADGKTKAQITVRVVFQRIQYVLKPAHKLRMDQPATVAHFWGEVVWDDLPSHIWTPPDLPRITNAGEPLAVAVPEDEITKIQHVGWRTNVDG